MSKPGRGITRRRVLTGAGAAATIGAVSLPGSRAGTAKGWDEQADLVVVGTGIGASTAAFTAATNGDSVLMVEKAGSFGGTTARSAGVFWIPNNFLLRARGITDKRADCLRYMARFSWPQRYNPDDSSLGIGNHAYSLLEAFYDNSYRAVDLLSEKKALKVREWRGFHLDIAVPDYLDHADENRTPSGRALAVSIGNDGTGLGAHLVQQMKTALDKNAVPVRYEHSVTRLITDSGRVAGVEAHHNDKTVALGARKGVVFATGGYAHNPDFIDYYQRSTIYGACASPMSTGDFINIAGAAGARMGNLSGAWRTQVILEQALENRVLPAGVFFPAGDSMIQVNRYGQRVVNEKRNYNDRTEIHSAYNPDQAEFPNHILVMIYDGRSAGAFAGSYPIPKKPADTPWVIQAATIGALADAVRQRLEGMANRTGGFSLHETFTANLKTTIGRFNRFAKKGRDEDFGRGATAYDREWHRVFSPHDPASNFPRNDMPNSTMYPVSDTGPYFAILLGPGCLDTNGGPMIDASARILDTENRPIPGLYGAGNCIASPSGEAYYGAGHTIGMAMTFGYIAANAANRKM